MIFMSAPNLHIPPEIFDAGGQKMVSFYTGQSQSLTPRLEWLIKAKRFINFYNSLPKTKRKGLYLKNYPDQNSFYALQIVADEDASGFEDWIEVAPEDQTDRPQEDYDPNDLSDLTLVAHHYEHEEGGPIVDYWNIDLKSILDKEEYKNINNL